jgi:hypothetical protein
VGVGGSAGVRELTIGRLNHETPTFKKSSKERTCAAAASPRRRSELAKIEKLTRQIQRLLQDVKRFQYLLHECWKLASMHAAGNTIFRAACRS